MRVSWKWIRRRAIAPAAVGTLGVVAAGCGGGGGGAASPTEIASSSLTLTHAEVWVGDEMVDGGTVYNDLAHPPSATRYQATLTENGQPVSGHPVVLDLQPPAGMPMSGGGPMGGQVQLWDDGTHGDRTPGDGHYAFEATEGRMGVHHSGVPEGGYTGEFWGMNPDGSETNHLMVHFEVVDEDDPGSGQPASEPIVLGEARVLVDGQVVNGSTVHQGSGHPGSVTRYEATLTQGGRPAPGHPVYVDLGAPSGMGHQGMNGPMGGQVQLWDDGAHGDHTAGDGHYAYEAGDDDPMGVHHDGAPHGEYTCDFWGEEPDGSDTNHLMVHFDVED